MLHDVAVVGAGPVGAALALALADADLDVVVLDARAPGEISRGDRSLALSHGARLILERLGVWRALATVDGAATPITAIDVSQSGGFGSLTLDAAAESLPALGYVVSYRALQAALDQALARTGATVRHGVNVREVRGTPHHALIDGDGIGTEPMQARMAAIADGSGAAVSGLQRRRHDYRQTALVARIWCDRSHAGRAFERFTPQGPVALLPEGDHYGLVWTATPERAAELLAQDDALFVATLAEHFGTRMGGFTRVADRRSFPLVLEYVHDPVATRRVVLGNAAQTLHPVAGQGFNVGLRDAYELAQVILDSPRAALGDDAMLQRYTDGRRADRLAGVAFTHGLVSVFGNDIAIARWSRGLALTLLDTLPVAKRMFTRAMLFGLH